MAVDSVCLFPAWNFACAHKDLWSIWAAWAQGLGSVAAIFVAVGVARAQDRREEARRRFDTEVAQQRRALHAAETLRHTRMLCIVFAAELRNVAHAYRVIAETQQRDREDTYRAILEDVVILSRQIDLSRVPDEGLDPVLALRQLAVEAQSAALEFAVQSSPNWDHWRTHFHGMHALVTGKMAEMEKCFAEFQQDR
jgi:hypothetical protein